MKNCWLFVLCLGMLSGCGGKSEIPRCVVSGKVTFRGEPIPDGMVVFVPIKGTKGPRTIAEIKQGSYEAFASGGVPVGSHRVEIQAYETAAVQTNRPPMMQGLPEKRQYLPDKFNSRSTLEVTIDESGSQTKDFELK